MSTGIKSSEKRTESLDVFKGVLIFLVVFGHFLLPIKEREYLLFNKLFFFIYSFHMPAFVFLSGYFYFEPWKKRGTKLKYFIPLIILFFLMKIFLHISDILFYGDTNIMPDFFHESSTPWYISTLIIFRLSLYPMELISKLQNNVENTNTDKKDTVSKNHQNKFFDFVTIYVMALMLVFIFISMLNAGWQVKIDDFLSLDRVVSFAPYFYLGILYKKYSSEIKTSFFEKVNIGFFVFGVACVLCFFVFFKYIRFYTMIFYGPWGYRIAEGDILPVFKGVINPLRIIYMPYALGTSYFIFVITSLKKNFSTNTLRRFGIYSLPIFVLHRPVRDAFSYLLLDNYIWPIFDKISILIILLAISFFTCLIFGNDKANKICRFK